MQYHNLLGSRYTGQDSVVCILQDMGLEQVEESLRPGKLVGGEHKRGLDSTQQEWWPETWGVRRSEYDRTTTCHRGK